MRITALFGILSVAVVACTQAPPVSGDRLRGGSDDSTEETPKTGKKKPAPSTDTPAGNDKPAPAPVPGSDQPPTLTAVSPEAVPVGSSATGVDLTLSGSKFPNTAQVNLAGDKFPATFVSPEQLKVHIPADKIKTTGTLRLSVVAKQGVESNALTFTVANPTSTTISTVTPPNTNVGVTNDLVIRVVGTGYTQQSIVKFNGAALTTNFTSNTELAATVPASALVDAGKVSITVTLGTDVISLPFSFEVRNPTPTAQTLNPSTVPAGAAATVTVSGTGFTKGSTVLAGGQVVSTTFVNANTLTALVPANVLSASGSVRLSVQNGAPGGGTSGALNLAVTTTGGSSSGGVGNNPLCAYQCNDYGYAPGQCYAGYYCITTGQYAGCLGQADCGDQGAVAGGGGAAGGGAGGGNQGANCAYRCVDYGYAPGECYQDWYCIPDGANAGCLGQTLCN